MALQLMRHRPSAFDYGVQLGGFVVDDRQPGDAELASIRPAVIWGRGARDSVIPASAIARTTQFGSTHFAVVERIYPELGHDVAGREIDDLAEFVTGALG